MPAKKQAPKATGPRALKSKGPFASIDEAVAAIRDGQMIIVVDDEDRENEGDLTIAAEKVSEKGRFGRNDRQPTRAPKTALERPEPDGSCSGNLRVRTGRLVASSARRRRAIGRPRARRTLIVSASHASRSRSPSATSVASNLVTSARIALNAHASTI